MTKTFIIDKGQKPTDEQLREAEEAEKYPIVFDEDCPELSPALCKAFRSSVVQRNRKEMHEREKPKGTDEGKEMKSHSLLGKIKEGK